MLTVLLSQASLFVAPLQALHLWVVPGDCEQQFLLPVSPRYLQSTQHNTAQRWLVIGSIALTGYTSQHVWWC